MRTITSFEHGSPLAMGLVCALCMMFAAACSSIEREVQEPVQASQPEAPVSLPPTWSSDALCKAMNEPGTPRSMSVVWQAGSTRLEQCFPGTLVKRKHASGVGYDLDTIFELGGMKAAIICTAAMSLVDEGLLGLNDSVAYWLPEFAYVLVGEFDEEGRFVRSRVPAREIRIGDLMTQTAGLPERWSGNNPRQRTHSGECILGHTKPSSLRALVRDIASMPLAYDPGTAWSRGCSTEVLAAVLEVIDQRPLDEVLSARVFTPLGMVDSSLGIPEGKRGRAVRRFVWTTMGSAAVQRVEVPLIVLNDHWADGIRLCSTVGDLAKYGEMMVGLGEREGVQVLSPQSARAMMTQRIGGLEQVFGTEVLGYGLGLALLSEPESESVWGWSGESSGETRSFAPSFFLDPERRMAAVFFCGRNSIARFRKAVEQGFSSEGQLGEAGTR